MSFSMETEKENKLSFLEIEIIREQGKFTTAVYRKYTRTRQIYNRSLSKLYASKANLQLQFIEIIREQGKFTTTVYRKSTLLVAYIVTLKVFYLWFINLVWYIL